MPAAGCDTTVSTGGAGGTATTAAAVSSSRFRDDTCVGAADGEWGRLSRFFGLMSFVLRVREYLVMCFCFPLALLVSHKHASTHREREHITPPESLFFGGFVQFFDRENKGAPNRSASASEGTSGHLRAPQAHLELTCVMNEM